MSGLNVTADGGGQARPAPPSRQQEGPYLCHALSPQGWLPPVEVASAKDAWLWVANPMRAIFDELRVTDATGDDCLINVVGDELKFPTHVECEMAEDVWRAFWEEYLEPRREARLRMQQ